MAFYPIALLPPQFSNPSNGENASGFILQARVAGTTTLTDFYSDSAGTSIGSSITLDSGGFTSVSGNVFVPYLDDAITYKFTLTDPDTLIQFTVDNITDVPNAQVVLVTGDLTSYVFENVADMQAQTTHGGTVVALTPGYTALTQGYGSAGDGGGAEYLVKTAAQASTDGDVIDEVINVTLSSGDVAIFVGAPVPLKYKLDLPTDFASFKLDPQIYNTGRKWRSQLNPRSLRGGYANEVYIDPIFGDDSSGDGSSGSPYQSVFAGVQDTLSKTIILQAGNYAYLNGPRGRIDPQNLDMICPIGEATFTNEVYPRMWRHISTYSKIHVHDETIALADRPELNNAAFILDKATGITYWSKDESDGGTPLAATVKIDTIVSGVMTTDVPSTVTLNDANMLYFTDTTVNGEDMNAEASDLRAVYVPANSRTVVGDQLTFGASILAVINDEHSWRADTDITVVHLVGGSAPTPDNLRIKYALENLAIIDQTGTFGDMALYFENINTTYGSPSSIRIFNGTSDSSIACVNCNFIGGQSSNTLEIYGHGSIVMWGCTASGAFKDGFNYHVNTTNTSLTDMDIFEYNCTAFDNGRGSTGTNNGSTAHETARIIRVNSKYLNNQNRNIHDINVVKTLMISCESRGGSTITDQDMVFGRDTSEVDQCRVYLIDCDADTVSYEYGTIAYEYVDNTFASVNVDSDATKTGYMPVGE